MLPAQLCREPQTPTLSIDCELFFLIGCQKEHCGERAKAPAGSSSVYVSGRDVRLWRRRDGRMGPAAPDETHAHVRSPGPEWGRRGLRDSLPGPWPFCSPLEAPTLLVRKTASNFPLLQRRLTRSCLSGMHFIS